MDIPAIFPKAHTACSLMWVCGEASREMKAGIAPPSTTALVCSDVPEAMLVSAQTDSNWIGLQSALPRNETNFGIKPARIMLSIGGCFSLERSFLRRKANRKYYFCLQTSEKQIKVLKAPYKKCLALS